MWGNHKNVLEFEETDYDGNVVRYDEDGYKIRPDNENYKNGKSKLISEVLYFSDFVLGINNMSDTVMLRLPGNIPQNAAYVLITAVDSWGAESNAVMCGFER